MANQLPAKPEPETKKSKATHIVVHPVRHDGKFYPRNSLMSLPADHAERLEDMGVIKSIVTPTPRPNELEPAVEG